MQPVRARTCVAGVPHPGHTIAERQVHDCNFRLEWVDEADNETEKGLRYNLVLADVASQHQKKGRENKAGSVDQLAN